MHIYDCGSNLCSEIISLQLFVPFIANMMFELKCNREPWQAKGELWELTAHLIRMSFSMLFSQAKIYAAQSSPTLVAKKKTVAMGWKKEVSVFFFV